SRPIDLEITEAEAKLDECNGTSANGGFHYQHASGRFRSSAHTGRIVTGTHAEHRRADWKNRVQDHQFRYSCDRLSGCGRKTRGLRADALSRLDQGRSRQCHISIREKGPASFYDLQ